MTGLRGKVMAAAIAATLSLGMASSANSPVADAAMRNDVETVRSLLKQGADANAAQGDGMTALHWAADHGNATIAQMLLHAGASAKATTRIGSFTPLHLASRAGSAPVAKLLIAAGSDVNAVTTSSGVTPLHFAAAAGNPDVVTALLEKGANANAREPEYGQTPLVFAAAMGHAQAIKVLIAKGADPNLVTRRIALNEASALDGAATRRRTEILNAIRPADRAAGYEPSSAEIQAAIRASREVYTAAVDSATRQAAQGAGRAIRDTTLDPGDRQQADGLVNAYGGFTPLHHAAREGNVEAARALLDGGANIDTPTGADRSTPLLLATLNGMFDVAKLLIERGAKPNLASDAGTTPLYAVLERRWANRTRFPQPIAVDYQKTGYIEVMEGLLKAGADPNVRLNRHLYYMTYQGCGNANCGLELVDGATPFWRASYATDVDAMRLLMKHGADPTIPTRRAMGGRGGGGGGGGRGGGGRGGGGGGAGGGRGVDGGGPGGAAAPAGAAVAAGMPPAAEPPGARAGGGGGAGGPGGPPDPTPGSSDPSGLPPAQPGGPAVYPLHAAAGVGYGEGFAGNSHRHAPDGWLPSVKFLIEEAKIDVNLRDENGYTALHHAAARGDNELILYLVSRGADVTAVSRRGQTTADMANGPVSRITPYVTTVRLLESLGSKNNHRCVSC